MSLSQHARIELERAGFFSKDSDYKGAMGKAVLELIDTFAKQGHSGASAQICLSVFEVLARFKTLTPLTSDPTEWNDVSSMSCSGPLWQNKRDCSYFSTDGGKTWYTVDERK